MPTTAHLEILVGQVALATDAVAAPSMPTLPGPEVGASGHYNTLRVMRCQSCGALSYIEYDPDITRDYVCSHCHVANTL